VTTPDKPPLDRHDQHDLDDPDAPASEEEMRAAEALRLALADEPREPGSLGRENLENDAADLARAVALAHQPRPLSSEEHRAIVARALSDSTRTARTTPTPRASKTRARAAWGFAATLSLAAAVALAVSHLGDERAMAPSAVAAAPVVVAHVRSTQELFHEPFQSTGGESARIDRIAMARASDLRDNRFAALMAREAREARENRGARGAR